MDYNYLNEEVENWLNKNDGVVDFTRIGRDYEIKLSVPYRKFLLDFINFTTTIRFLHIEHIHVSATNVTITIM